MKNLKSTVVAAVLAILATQQAAQATLYSSGSATLTQLSGPPSMTVSWYVDLTGLVYTYEYMFTPVAGPITDFTINAQYVTSTLNVGASTFFGAVTKAGANNASLVDWNWGTLTGTTLTQIVGFTSLLSPINGTGSLNDGTTGPWSNNGNPSGTTPLPVPGVPEASTIMAGALMLLPLGIGAVRSLRKERAV